MCNYPAGGRAVDSAYVFQILRGLVSVVLEEKIEKKTNIMIHELCNRLLGCIAQHYYTISRTNILGVVVCPLANSNGIRPCFVVRAVLLQWIPAAFYATWIIWKSTRAQFFLQHWSANTNTIWPSETHNVHYGPPQREYILWFCPCPSERSFHKQQAPAYTHQHSLTLSHVHPLHKHTKSFQCGSVCGRIGRWIGPTHLLRAQRN